ncbi:MAG: EpsG family protein [Bacteroidota bacterium]
MSFKKSNLFFFCILLLIIFIPWELFSPGRFEDLSVYKDYLVQNLRHDETIFNAPAFFFFREIFFQQWLFFLYDFFQDEDLTIKVVSAITILIFFKGLKGSDTDFRVYILLICPLMIDFFNSQLRNSLAVSIFLVAISLEKRYIRYSLFAICIAVHLGSLLLIGTFFIVEIIFKVVKNKTLQFLIISLYCVAAAFGDQLFFILIDDPRIDVYSGQGRGGMSLIYFIWSLVFLLAVLIHRRKDNANNIYINYALTASLLVVLCYFSGSYYGRYLAMFFPLILLSIGKIRFNNWMYWTMLFYSGYTFFMNFIV